jgi:ankyrin repeat protein
MSAAAAAAATQERNEYGQTLFLAACWYGNVEIAMQMAADDPDVVDDVDTIRKQTALHIVCVQIVKNFSESTHLRYWRLLKWLLTTNIDVDAQDTRQWTALHYLLSNRLHTDWLAFEIEFLLERRPNLALKDDQGRAPSSPTDFPFFHKFFEYDEEKKQFVRKQ